MENETMLMDEESGDGWMQGIDGEWMQENDGGWLQNMLNVTAEIFNTSPYQSAVSIREDVPDLPNSIINNITNITMTTDDVTAKSDAVMSSPWNDIIKSMTSTVSTLTSMVLPPATTMSPLPRTTEMLLTDAPPIMTPGVPKVSSIGHREVPTTMMLPTSQGDGPDLSLLGLLVILIITVVANLVVITVVKLDKRLHHMTYYFFVSMAVVHLLMAGLVMPPGILVSLAGRYLTASMSPYVVI